MWQVSQKYSMELPRLTMQVCSVDCILPVVLAYQIDTKLFLGYML